MSLRVGIVTPIELELRAEDVLRRLEALRDPIRLKEHLFWMIPLVRIAGHLERSVEVCNRAIELAARLNVPPVQYPTFKALALVPLGRFDEAWRSIEQEVVHGGYRFGAALQWLGFFYLKAEVGAVAEVLAEAEALVAECRALNRIWMVEMIVDVLATTGARAGAPRETIELLQRCAADVAPRGTASAHLALAQGNANDALTKAQRAQKTYTERGAMQLAANAGEVVSHCALCDSGARRRRVTKRIGWSRSANRAAIATWPGACSRCARKPISRSAVRAKPNVTTKGRPCS